MKKEFKYKGEKIMLEIRISTKTFLLAEIVAPMEVLNNRATQDQIVFFLRRNMEKMK